VFGGLNICRHLLLCDTVDGFALIGAGHTYPGASELRIQWSLEHLSAQTQSEHLDRALID
jgi:hypothetical protein